MQPYTELEKNYLIEKKTKDTIKKNIVLLKML